MVCVHLHFPLGTYHALAERDGPGPAPEWAPSPVRLIGALVAAAHEVQSDDIEADRAVLSRLCAERPPTLHAPRAVPQGEQARGGVHEGAVAELRGANRWAPRNPGPSEVKGISPRVVGRSRTEVDKSGIAVGERPVAMAWPDLVLSDDEMSRLRRMAADVAWLGTSRSPVIASVDNRVDLGDFADHTAAWTPLAWDSVLAEAQVRIPDPLLLDRFDIAYAARRSVKGGVESSGQQRPAAGGTLWPYVVGDATTSATVDPKHWGRFAVVVLDEASEMTPRTPSAYLIARALRAALMDAFAERGQEGEAPGVIHGHGDAPHVAIVPLPFVGSAHADGAVHGIGLVFPHVSRLPEVDEQQKVVERALLPFFPEASGRRAIHVPGAGSLFIRPPSPGRDRQWTLSPARYAGPSKAWVTATPVVHSRWRKGDEAEGLAAQIAADCAHVGLPEPAHIEILRAPGALGGAYRLVPNVKALPSEWRKSLQGPRSHLRLEFDREIHGPLLLGRARHFGVGLLVPQDDS